MSNITAGFPRRNGKNRTEHACEQCRQRKRRCDGDYPCNCCKEGMLVCKYTSRPSNKASGMFIELNREINRLSQHQKVLVGRIEILEARLEHAVATMTSSQYASQRRYSAHKTSRFLQLAQASRQYTAGQHDLVQVWPSLLPLLQSANISIESDYLFWLERYRSPLTSSRQYLPTITLRADSARSSPRMPSEADRLLNERSRHTQRLRVSKIRSLIAEYERHIRILLPFLDRQELRTLCDNFVNWRASRLSERDYPLRHKHAINAADHDQSDTTNGPPVGLCLEHALVYMIIALGHAVAQKRFFETGVRDDHIDITASPINSQYDSRCSQNGLPETTEGPRSTDLASNSTVYTRADEMWTTVSAESTLYSPVDSKYEGSYTSMDLAAGVDDYEAAQRTLEQCPHNDELLLAQIYLLTGLYSGQLAFVTESMKWYKKAGKLLLLLLDRYNLYADETSSQDGLETQFRRTQDRIKDQRHNLIVLASWTCLQLEGEIQSEFDLPSSGLESVQHLLPLPLDLYGGTYGQNATAFTSTSEADLDRGDLLMHFTAQSFLQKRLNAVHTQLYSPECLDYTLKEVQEIMHGHQETLGHWQERLPEGLRWDSSNPPPSDILAARLQAKYWHAQCIMTRPFLDFVLHILPHISAGRAVEDTAIDIKGAQRSAADMQIFKAIQSMQPDTVWQACERCIEAAARSTIVFDGIPGPLVVTNVHGTAHAQFSNMLVLAACWQDNGLRKTAEQWRFPALLDRTIVFIGGLEDLSPTCRADHEILVKLKVLLFGQGVH